MIIIPSYKNWKEVEECLTSVLRQHYPKTRFRIAYGDDYSPDNSIDILMNFMRKQTKTDQDLFSFQFNKERKYACWMRNYLIKKFVKEDEICVLLDGDDKLSDAYVLSYLNQIYQTEEVWMTYGGYSSSDGKRKDWGDWPIEYKQKMGGIRESGKWYGSCLRTFYAKLYAKVKMDELLDEEYNWFESATEVAIMVPMLEMSGNEHTHYVNDGRILYLYTIHPNQQYNPERVAKQRKNAKYIFENKKYYLPLESL